MVEDSAELTRKEGGSGEEKKTGGLIHRSAGT